VTATDPNIGSASADTKVRLGGTAEMTIVLVPTTASTDAAKAAELKKAFDEGVTASRAGNHDAAIEKFRLALALAPSCFDCHYNIGVAYMAKKDEKAAEAAWKQAIEVKADYAEAMKPSTLCNQRCGEAAAMSELRPRAAAPVARTPPSTASSSGTRARYSGAWTRAGRSTRRTPTPAIACMARCGGDSDAVGAFESSWGSLPGNTRAGRMIAQPRNKIGNNNNE
jgi:tetratricopeptide (TPR) repeat protein